MRAVVGIFLGEHRGRGEKSRVPAHDNRDVNAGKAAVIEIEPGKGKAHEPARRAEPRAVVGDPQVVVDGLGDVYHPQFVPGLFCVFIHNLAGVGGVVAADIVEIPHVMSLENLEYFLAVFLVGFVAGGKHGRRGGKGDLFQIVGCRLRKVEKILLHNTAHAVKRAVNVFDARVFSCLQNGADKALVDDCGGPAALRDDCFSHKFCHG